MSHALSFSLTSIAYQRPVAVRIDLSQIYRSDWFKFASGLVTVTSIFASGAIWIMALQSL